MKKYLPIIFLVLSIVLLVYIGLFLASERATRGIERLEDDLTVVEDTQFQILKELTATNSATISATPTIKFRPLPSSGSGKAS